MSTYIPWSLSKVDASANHSLAFAEGIRENQENIMDKAWFALHQGGGNFVHTRVDGTGTTENPQYIKASSGATTFRVELVWNADGTLQSAKYEYSSDTEATWDNIHSTTNSRLNFTYNSEGQFLSAAWD